VCAWFTVSCIVQCPWRKMSLRMPINENNGELQNFRKETFPCNFCFFLIGKKLRGFWHWIGRMCDLAVRQTDLSCCVCRSFHVSLNLIKWNGGKRKLFSKQTIVYIPRIDSILKFPSPPAEARWIYENESKQFPLDELRYRASTATVRRLPRP